MPFILLAILIPYVLVNAGMAAVRTLQLSETTRQDPQWRGHLIYAIVFGSNALAFLILYATYLLHTWDY